MEILLTWLLTSILAALPFITADTPVDQATANVSVGTSQLALSADVMQSSTALPHIDIFGAVKAATVTPVPGLAQMADSSGAGEQVYWSKMQDMLDSRLKVIWHSGLAEMTQSVTKAVEENLASKFQNIDSELSNLNTKIGNEVTQLRNDLETHKTSVPASLPKPEEWENLRRRVEDLEANDEASRERIKALEDLKDVTLSRTEALESQVALLTNVAVGVIDHARGMSDHITDIEGRLRRGNVRIYNVAEGSENDYSGRYPCVPMVEDMIKAHLDIDNFQVERAHRSRGAPSPPDRSPRSIVVKFTRERDQEEILKKVWSLKGFMFNGMRVSFGRDNANAIQDRINAFHISRKKLQELHIKFRTGQWGQLMVSYTDPSEETETYWTTFEAYQGMTQRGIVMDRVEPPLDLVEELKKATWSVKGQQERTREAYKAYIDGQQLGKSRGPGARSATRRQPKK